MNRYLKLVGPSHDARRARWERQQELMTELVMVLQTEFNAEPIWSPSRPRIERRLAVLRGWLYGRR